MQFIQ